MRSYKAILMGGVAVLGLVSIMAASDNDGRMFASQVKVRLAQHETISDLRNHTRVAEEQKPASDAPAAAPPAASQASKTEYYGVSDSIATPQWAAEAKFVNADAAVESAPAGEMQPTAGSAETPAAAPPAETPAPSAPAPTAAAAMPEVVHGTTWYPGETSSSEGQAFSAPATVFEEVKVMEPATEAAPAAAEAPAAAPSPAAAMPEVVHGTTWYPGETASAEGQPFSAPATVYIQVTDAPAAKPVAPVEIVHGTTWYPGETHHRRGNRFPRPQR